MFSHKADGPLTVHVPGPGEDRPAWGKVGALAAAGFLLGIAWPKIAGVRLGPSVPESASAAAVASASPGTTSPGGGGSAPALAARPGAANAPAAAAVASSPGAPAATAAGVAAAPSVSVSRGAVYSCHTSDGDRLKGGDCGPLPGLDGIVRPRLRRLAGCPDAAGVSGRLHVVVRPDFRRGAFSVDLSSHNAGISPSDGLLACAKADMAGAGAALGDVTHDNPRYSVSYTVTFGAGGVASSAASSTTPAAALATAAPRASGEATSADGSAQVVWDVAIIRDAPKSGKVVARLPRGTTIRLGAVKDGWYPVRYGEGLASEGWVYRGAVGR